MRYLSTRISQENGRFFVEFRMNTWPEGVWSEADFDRFATREEAKEHEAELWRKAEDNM